MSSASPWTATSVAVAWSLLSLPLLAQEPPAADADAAVPDAPAVLPAVVPVEAPAEEPGLTPEEQAALNAAMAADAKPSSSSSSSSLPDLTQVNLGAALPQMLQSMNPDIALLFNGTASYFSVDAPLQTGEHDPDRTGFKLQQIEMQIGASVDPFARFDANIVFKGDGVEVEEVYATTTALPWNLQLRAGQFLSRVGRTNEQHPHTWAFIDQPLIYGKIFGGDNNRGGSAELSWLAPLPWYVNTFVTVQDPAGECCARTFAPVDVLTLKNPLDLVYAGVVEQFFPFTDDLSLLWGLSAMTGPGKSLDDGARAEVYVTDLMLRYAPVAGENRWAFTWLTEGFLRHRHGATDVAVADIVDGGGFSQVVWRINPWWDLGGRLDVVESVAGDPLDPGDQGLRTRFALEGSWFPSHFSRLRLEGSVDAPPTEPAPIYALMLQLEVVVGAHGAHAY